MFNTVEIRPFQGMHAKQTALLARFLGLCCVALLTACGGGGDAAQQERSAEVPAAWEAPSFLPESSEPPSRQTIELQREGGEINARELQTIRKTTTLPPSSGGRSLSGFSPKAGVTQTPAFRFFNTRTGAHFYTTSTAERDQVRATLPFMSYEGPAFDVSASALNVLSPVYRFYNRQTGVHFYTISEEEKAHIIATLPQFTFEGVAYHASVLEGTGYVPLFRFFLRERGYHFYTASVEERDRIRATLPQYAYEGIAYHVLGADWVAPGVAPSGTTTLQCYGVSGDGLRECSSNALLNPLKQDGHRSRTAGLSYSPVSGQSSDDCLKDNNTGLVWEMKTFSGLRSFAGLYTHVGNGAANDASGYVSAVNRTRLCGFSDWRLPTFVELTGLVNYGTDTTPLTDLPISTSTPHWTSTMTGNSHALQVDFATGMARNEISGVTAAVRLVRGAPWSGPRFMLMTKPYLSDATNNVAVDRSTGLVWRRCAFGLSWNGQACVGAVIPQTHPDALLDSTYREWGMPDIKELASLGDYSHAAGLFVPDLSVFPGADRQPLLWASTPYLVDPSRAWALSFDTTLMTQVVRGTRQPYRMLWRGKEDPVGPL